MIGHSLPPHNCAVFPWYFDHHVFIWCERGLFFFAFVCVSVRSLHSFDIFIFSSGVFIRSIRQFVTRGLVLFGRRDRVRNRFREWRTFGERRT